MCFNERPWDAATVSGALAEVSQLLVKQWYERDINPDVSR